MTKTNTNPNWEYDPTLGMTPEQYKELIASAARSVIVPFMKTHSTKNPFDPNSPDVRSRTYLHPNERFKKFGTWDKI